MVQNITKLHSSHIVFVSSMTVYNSIEKTIVKEDNISKNLKGYARSKKLSEDLILKSKLNSTILRFPGLFGRPRKNGLVYNYIKSKIREQKFIYPKNILYGVLSTLRMLLIIVSRQLLENLVQRTSY